MGSVDSAQRGDPHRSVDRVGKSLLRYRPAVSEHGGGGAHKSADPVLWINESG